MQHPSIHPPQQPQSSAPKRHRGVKFGIKPRHMVRMRPLPHPHTLVCLGAHSCPALTPLLYIFKVLGGRDGRDLGSITQTSPKHQSFPQKTVVSSRPPPSRNKFWGAKPIQFALHPQPDPPVAAFVCKLLRNCGEELQLPSCAGPKRLCSFRGC